MKRILLIMGNMGLGGAETQVMKVYRAINRENIQFDFCVNTKEKSYYEDEITKLGGKIYRTPSKTTHPIQYFIEIFNLCKQYDVVFKCSENASAWMEMCVAKYAGIGIRAVRSTNTQISSGGLPLLAHYFGKPLLNYFANYKIAPSKEAGEWLFGKKQNKVSILPNGIDTRLFSYSEEDRERMRKELGIDNEIVFGTVGRMSNQKNQLFLIDVFKRVHDRNVNTKLIIVGDGELRNQVEARIRINNLSDSVILTGKSDKVPQLLMAMDIFCLPSLYEGMPNCVIEAEGTGLKCIVSDTVTKEANITGNVVYVPLKESEWEKALIEGKVENDRLKQGKKLKSAGYDINNIAAKIEKYLLEYS